MRVARLIMSVEQDRRGAALIPSLTELGAAMILGTTDEVIQLYSDDETTRSEIIRRINTLMNYEPAHTGH